MDYPAVQRAWSPAPSESTENAPGFAPAVVDDKYQLRCQGMRALLQLPTFPIHDPDASPKHRVLFAPISPDPRKRRVVGQRPTEWSNVAKARARFPGHQQPHLPADLGFYDLRLAEAREAQATLARDYGVGGFCYYHYWFNGRRIIERPFSEVLASGKPSLPFCLCWANHSWSAIWVGDAKKIIFEPKIC